MIEAFHVIKTCAIMIRTKEILEKVAEMGYVPPDLPSIIRAVSEEIVVYQDSIQKDIPHGEEILSEINDVYKAGSNRFKAIIT